MGIPPTSRFTVTATRTRGLTILAGTGSTPWTTRDTTIGRAPVAGSNGNVTDRAATA